MVLENVFINRERMAEYYSNGYWHTEDFWTSFEKVASALQDKTALVEDETELSFGELKRRAVQFAAAAGCGGLVAGDRVVIYGRHCMEAVVAILGCSYAGLVPALIPSMFSTQQVLRIIENTQSTLLLALGEEAEIERACSAIGECNRCALVVADQFAGAGMLWSEFMASGSGRDAARPDLSPDDLMLLIYSSGTTGEPKGVMHSANTARFAINGYARMQDLSPDDTCLVATAFGFVGSSLLGFYLTLVRGCTSVLLRNWNADQALALIPGHSVSHLLLMPTHAIDILNSAKLDQTDCSSLTRGVVAGLSEEHRIEAKTRLCKLPFPMYGMSESPAHVTGSMGDDWELLRRTEGRPMPGTDLLICDDEDEPLPPGQPGHILVRGPNRFLGYFRQEELTRSVINDQGYFRTGDIGYLDGQGFLTFVSRDKDIIRRGGVTITPADIEAALRSHPRVKDCAVIGLPDPRLGERACVCVITRDGQDISLDEITEHLSRRDVARYLWPESVSLCEDFPRTPSLKVQKNELRKRILGN